MNNLDKNMNDNFTVESFVSEILRFKFLIITFIIFTSFLGGLSSYLITDIYKSSTRILISEESSDLSNIGSSIGGLAALSGLNLDSMGGNKDLKSYSLEYIKSREFINNFINKHDLLLPLMATKSWNKILNEISYDEKKFDIVNKKWIIKSKPPKGPKPSDQDSYKEFMKIFSLTEERNSNFITLSIEHESPYIAQEWLNLLVTDLNNVVREKELSQAQKALDYLNDVSYSTSIKNIDLVLFDLIESKIRTIMLANIKDEFIFEIVDPPIVSERRDSPNRILIALIGTFVGIFMTLIFLIRSLYLKRNVNENK